ncbi:cell wall hydrolase [Acinetobacter higginsii]|uniref:cell wall hydrolase n=1 Tax=Acinetobacter higginsii TaxID=70347 RepID=UPI001F4B8C3C|nr:cell wall hydrolase [Acinetobacter higginsii]MCH7380389.1 cell wall hydrolase [Acinetobacter higginsii]
MADGVIRDFLVSLGFDTDNTGLANMKSAMDGIEWKAKALNGALLALATGAVLAVKQTASELDKLYFSSQRIGASVTNINAYGNAIAQLGGSAEGAVGTLEALAEKIRNSPGYEGQIKSLGVNTRDANGAMRDRVEVMKDLSGVLSKMPAYQANAYANSLGIDQKTLLAMRDGKFMANMEKYQKIQKELGMNNDLAKSGNEFMTEYRDLTMMTKTGFQVIVMQAGKALIPILRMLNQLIQAGIHAFSQLNPQIKEGLAVGLRFAMLALMFGAMAKSIGLLLKFIPAFKTFIGLLKLFRLAFLATPIGIILALGAALALLYDDYKTWKEGGKSLFDWSKWTNGIDTIINKIKDFLDILDKIKDKTIEFIQKIIKDPAGALKEVATEVQEGVTKTAEKVNDAVDKYINPTDPKKVTPTQDKVASITDFAFSMVDKGLAMFGNADAQTRVEQRERGEIGYQSVATGAAKAAVSAVKNAVKTGKELKLSEQDIVDIMKVASTEVVGSLKGKSFELQAAGVIDTILNRTASGKYGKTLRDVVNQPYAFSDINSNQKTAYGSVQKVPMSRVTKRMDQFVRGYLEARANGQASSVGQNISYANPNFLGKASANTKKWVAEVVEQAKVSGQKYGAGNAIHVHGTPSADKHKMPKPYYISTPSSASTPKGSASLADFAQNAPLPNILSFGPPSGNPHKSQTNNSSALTASNVVINQTYQTDMTINGASSPIDSANAVKRQQENSLVFMARGAKGAFVG